MGRMNVWPIILIGMAILVVGCTPTGQGTTSNPIDSSPTAVATSVPISPSRPTPTAEASPSAQPLPTAAPTLSPAPTTRPPLAATSPATLPTPARPTRSVPAGGSPEASVPPEATAAVNLARQQLSTQTGVRADQIQVVSVSSVQWPTSALGCPQPGRMYAQVVTPGYRIILTVAGRTYEYHSDSGRRVISCPTP